VSRDIIGIYGLFSGVGHLAFATPFEHDGGDDEVVPSTWPRIEVQLVGVRRISVGR